MALFSPLVCSSLARGGVGLGLVLLLALPGWGEGVHPLSLSAQDPLIPTPTVPRPLSPLERYRIEEAIAQWPAQAASLPPREALALWYRLVHLQQYRGDRLGELRALQAAGKLAWDNNWKEEIQAIRAYLNQLPRGDLTVDQVQGLIAAYDSIHDLDQLLSFYRAWEKTGQFPPPWQDRTILDRLGSLYLDQFRYEAAATIYQKLVQVAQGDGAIRDRAWDQLIYIYDHQGEHHQAIAVKSQRLPSLPPDKQAALHLSLGQNYQALNQEEAAMNHYRQAFTLGEAQQQWSVVMEALQSLAALYQTSHPAIARQLYEQLLKVQSFTGDAYGADQTRQAIATLTKNL